MYRFVTIIGYTNKTITLQDIVHCPVFSLNYNVLETEFSFRVEVEPTKIGHNTNNLMSCGNIGSSSFELGI
jgi:hypothetical protein